MRNDKVVCLSRVTRSEGLPVILNVEGIRRTDIKFSVDLVPSFKFDIRELEIACAELYGRIITFTQKNNISNVQNFMAIALKKASSDMFEIDFHDVERGLLRSVGGCVYKVIMLMKYFRDTKGGTLTKLKSHLIKVMKNTLNGIKIIYLFLDDGNEPCFERGY